MRGKSAVKWMSRDLCYFIKNTESLNSATMDKISTGSGSKNATVLNERHDQATLDVTASDVQAGHSAKKMEA